MLSQATEILGILPFQRVAGRAEAQGENLPSASLVNIETWITVAWLPLIVVLNRERSLWVSVALLCMAGCAVRFLERGFDWHDSDEKNPSEDGQPCGLFRTDPTPPLWRTLWPTVIAIQAGIGALLLGRALIAGGLFAISFAILHWRSRSKRHAVHLDRDRQRVLRSSFLNSLLILALIGAALMPFLKRGQGKMGMGALLGMRPTPSSPPALNSNGHTSGLTYSGVVLVLPEKPHHEIMPPVHSDAPHLAGALAKPTVIPFDGAYWYFKRPDIRPKPDARVQRGDPLKVNIRSTDRIPLSMAAHQVLPSSILIDCCRTLRVELVNADNRLGTITIEVLLRDTSTRSAPAVALGSVVIPSSKARSISLMRPPIKEVLTFQFPAAAPIRKFDEITLMIRPAWERGLAGSRVSIQNFVLVP